MHICERFYYRRGRRDGGRVRTIMPTELLHTMRLAGNAHDYELVQGICKVKSENTTDALTFNAN